MNCSPVTMIGTWRSVADACRTTVGKEPGEGEPSDKWKRQLLLSEHSPIRLLHYHWKWTDLPYWVSVHLTRHKVGIEHWVRSQRTDRTGVSRDELPQGALVEHECEANAQAIINISRKRLCSKASPETRAAWEMFLARLDSVDTELYEVCVCECQFRGFCPESVSCNRDKTSSFLMELGEYRGR